MYIGTDSPENNITRPVLGGDDTNRQDLSFFLFRVRCPLALQPEVVDPWQLNVSS